jgi:hypothetical protein
MSMLVTNPYFDPDVYLASGGQLTKLDIPRKEERFWEAQAETTLSNLGADEQLTATVRFERLRAFCERLGEEVISIGDVFSEEEAQTAWRQTATLSPGPASPGLLSPVLP